MATDLGALIIVEMQRCMAEPVAGARNNPDAEANIASLLGVAARPAPHRARPSPYQELSAPCFGQAKSAPNFNLNPSHRPTSTS